MPETNRLVHCDLHMHSTFSDGKYTPIELLEMAEANHLEYIAITDHNTTDAYDYLKTIDISKYYSGTILYGAELSTAYNGIEVELLGYGIDLELMKKTNLHKSYLEFEQMKKNEQWKVLRELGKRYGMVILPEEEEIGDQDSYAADKFLKVLRSHPENTNLIDHLETETIGSFYRNYMTNKESRFYVNIIDKIPPLEKVIDWINNTLHGIIVIPHPFIYKEQASEVITEFLRHPEIQGIECSFPSFTIEQEQYLKELCQARGYLITGGSDLHDATKTMGIATAGEPIFLREKDLEILRERCTFYRGDGKFV